MQPAQGRAQGRALCGERQRAGREITVEQKKPTWYLTIGPVAGAVLCIVWLVRVWRGDNPTDNVILMVLALLTVASSVYVAAVIKKRGS